MELSQLQKIYADYGETLAPIQKKAGILSTLFGQQAKEDPRNAPCNREFYERVRQWTRDFGMETQEQETLLEAALYLLETPESHPKSPTYWYELVAQEFIRYLLPQLSENSKKALAKRLDALYPPKKRLPLQNALYQDLTK